MNFMANRDLGDETTSSIQTVIDRLEQMPKQGVSYDDKGRHGWRNPVRGDTGPLLRDLVAAEKPNRILELGTAHGLSACYIGQGNPTARLVTIEWDEATARQAQANLVEAGLSARVMCGDIMKILEGMTGQFDMVFLDANKDGYYEQILKLQERRLLAKGCLIVADNVIDRMTECQNFLIYMHQHPHVIIKTEVGLLVGRI